MARVVHTATATAFLATSISLYLNLPWTQRIWRLCRAQDGRDWMLNSGVFRFDFRNAGRRTHLVGRCAVPDLPLVAALR